MPTALSSALGFQQPRRQIVTLTSSNASVPIPSWAQGGKGIVYVTGCGGGGAGSLHATSGAAGSGGGGGGMCLSVPVVIPSGTATMAATIGAGGAAATGTAVTAGGSGGDTILTVAGFSIRLVGGSGATTSSGAGTGGRPRIGAHTDFATLNAAEFAPNGTFSTGTQVNPTLIVGQNGGAGTTANNGFGAGASGLFGGGGDSRAAAPTANSNGGNATGYGAGGAGGLWVSGGAASSGAGSPGLLILEFVEGF